MKRILAPVLIAVLGTALFSGLLYVSFYRSLDSRLYDLLLRIKPGIEEDKSILLLEVDDPTISAVDMYPLGRDIFADGLILVKEFGPSWTMLDVEFVDRSPSGINLDYLDNVLPVSVQDVFEHIKTSNRELVNGIIDGRIDRKTAVEYLQQLETMTTDESNNLYEQIRGVAFDKDVYLGKAVSYLGDVSVTLNMADEVDKYPDSDAKEFVRENRWVKVDLQIEGSPWDPENLQLDPQKRSRKPVAKDLVPSIMPITAPAAWSGFPRMFIDSDGVRRRIDVLFQNDGAFYTHMGFGTWWLREGKPALSFRNNTLYAGDVKIPLDRDGKMLINWPKRRFDGSPLGRRAAATFDPTSVDFRLSFLSLYNHDVMWRDLKAYIGEMEYYGITSDLYGKTLQPLGVLQENLDAERTAMLDAGDGSGAGDLSEKKDAFLQTAHSFFTEEAKGFVLADLEFALDDPNLLPEQIENYRYLVERVPVLFDEAAGIVTDLIDTRNELRRRIGGTTVVVGYTGTSTTDYGANPFQEKYMNMGIYGAVYNSLLQLDFLSESPMWLTVLVTLFSGVLIAGVSLIAIKKSSLNTAIGLIALVLVIVAAGSVFVFTGLYLNMLPILLVLITTYITSQLGNFLTASQERSFIENAFGQTISPVVVNQILENPSRLNMYGERRTTTSMFTDIEKFSTLTEKLSKTGEGSKLFEILKRYLTPLSDIILDENGTIDKFEGDAIIAFWNAPLDQEDHAARASRAAMRMVKAEEKINMELLQEGLLSQEIVDMLPKGRLFTRIGMHTGPNDVGFIGTDRRKSYTALGDNMNLAARLEGVNKKYNTQVLISDETEKIIHTEFITRQLDKVRVEGKDDIITLYELTCFKEDFSEIQRECFNNYREGLKHFRSQEWDESEKLFRVIAEKLPGDGPTNVFLDRIAEYRKKRLPKNWDGVYRMEFK